MRRSEAVGWVLVAVIALLWLLGLSVLLLRQWAEGREAQGRAFFQHHTAHAAIEGAVTGERDAGCYHVQVWYETPWGWRSAWVCAPRSLTTLDVRRDHFFMEDAVPGKPDPW